MCEHMRVAVRAFSSIVSEYAMVICRRNPSFSYAEPLINRDIKNLSA